MSEVQRIKRDLSRWSRKLLLCLGLETIGKSLVGEENWKELYPVNRDWDDSRLILSDFDPNDLPQQPEEEEDSEFTEPNPFYSSSTPPGLSHQGEPSTTTEDDEPNGEKNEILENFIHLLPYWYFLRAFGIGVPPGHGLENISGDLSGAHPPGLESLDAQRLQSLLLLHTLKQQQQLQIQTGESQGIDFASQLRNLPLLFGDNQQESSNGFRTNDSGFINNPLQHGPFSGPISPQDELDQPLDLTKKDKSENSYDERNNLYARNNMESYRNGNDVRTESQVKPITRSTNRTGRAYTSVELEAALNDIQSGKLGTRRAAVIYGIPRSTLRNKVYKLGKDRNGVYKRREITKVTSSPTFTTGASAKNSRGSNNSESPEAANFDRLNTMKDGECQDDEMTEDDIEVKSEEEMSQQKRYIRDWLQSRKESRSMFKNKAQGNSTEISSMYNNENSSCDENSDDDRRTQRYLNTEYENEEGRAKSRRLCKSEHDSYRIGNSANSFPQMELDWNNHRSQINEDCSNDGSEMDSRSRSNRGSSGHNISFTQDQPMTSSFMTDSNEKKSRPKRGKYRNYDREALLKAVKAVQNGIMSVHRAGSHFGVPHSTLEYKVKERHLLRRPKKKGILAPQRNSPDSSPSGSDPLPSIKSNLPSTDLYASDFGNSLHRKTQTSQLYETDAGDNDSNDQMSNKKPEPDHEQQFLHSLNLDELIRKNLDNGTNNAMDL